MVSSWFQYNDKLNLKNKTDLKFIPRLVYKDKEMRSFSSSIYDIVDKKNIKMLDNETMYLGVIPKNEVLQKVGFGHFYLYHPCNMDAKNINELEDSLKLFAIIVINCNAGVHIPIVMKNEYNKQSRTIENYYALGSFVDNDNKFRTINDLINHYKRISPQQIIKDNKKFPDNCKTSGPGNNLSSINNHSSSVTNKPMVQKNQEKHIDKDKKKIVEKNITNNNCDEETDQMCMETFSDISMSLPENNDKGKELLKKLSIKNCVIKKPVPSQKCISFSKNKPGSGNVSESTSQSKSTSLKSSDPSTTLIEKFDNKKNINDKKLIRDDNFYNNYYLGELKKKDLKGIVKKPFDFAFYHREISKKNKKKKKIMYMVYKQLEGKLIHLPITRKRNPKYDGSKSSVKRFYVLKTPYDDYDYFNSFKEIVDYFYDRIEKVKELHQKSIS